MKNVDYIIVGDGYAAFFFAHQLILHQKSFVLFSADKKGASQVSAGIVNPLVLKKFTTFWLAAEQIEFLTKTVSEIETYTGENYLIQEKIHRIFHDEREKELWLMKAETDELKPFLNPDFETLETIINPFGTGEVNQSARLDVNGFFKGISAYLQDNEMVVKEKFDYSKIEGSSYDGFTFKNIVFCEGMGVRENPFFADIQVIANKGHHLKVKLSEKMKHQYTLKKKHFLFPLNNDIYYYGGTYDPNERENEIDDFKTEELKEGLSAFYPHDFEVEEVNYGFRPTVKDRRPIIGNLPEHQNYYIFNGLGARGILNGCYFSKELYEHIENGRELMKEVDLKRFNK
ncbi:NAD(P)/FAD-dependent oxidoreductase [Chryseobacterium salivictor]|uniref:tRNA 5-methylaminomethyl-2-thiouridine biosynthesis bifunctional protein MnmC n=1 Tax=Chryseobacterium salivictor TaxID=2547600 RepID=A0A4P6ZCE9_9FLAO|nr:FAD-dependent oxidoreductase [Chryseobacterium salivictor]QBO57176.1 tRNA 5-methylaminomethyl-2-thiouridine biosynthesis bifunctional protein MnmC [Chryseobacterium salivictor]